MCENINFVLQSIFSHIDHKSLLDHLTLEVDLCLSQWIRRHRQRLLLLMWWWWCRCWWFRLPSTLRPSCRHMFSYWNIIITSCLMSRPGVKFINVLRAAFTSAHPKCTKRDSQVISVFLCFWDLCAQMLKKLTPDGGLTIGLLSTVLLALSRQELHVFCVVLVGVVETVRHERCSSAEPVPIPIHPRSRFMNWHCLLRDANVMIATRRLMCNIRVLESISPTFTRSFYMHRTQKHKKHLWLDSLFCPFGICRQKIFA